MWKSPWQNTIARAALVVFGLVWLASAPAVEPEPEPAPAFTLPTDRGEITLAQLQGQVVYVDFWASWCGPCRKSFPWMNALAARYEKAGLRIVAINLDTERDLSARFLEKYPARFTVAYDPQGEVADKYHVAGMPSAYLIDRQGRIHSTHLGFREEAKDSLEAEIRALLASQDGG